MKKCIFSFAQICLDISSLSRVLRNIEIKKTSMYYIFIVLIFIILEHTLYDVQLAPSCILY